MHVTSTFTMPGWIIPVRAQTKPCDVHTGQKEASYVCIFSRDGLLGHLPPGGADRLERLGNDLISAVKKLRSGKHREENEPADVPYQDRCCLPPARLDTGGRDRQSGSPSVPLN